MSTPLKDHFEGRDILAPEAVASIWLNNTQIAVKWFDISSIVLNAVIH